jgi:hypothetical protein
MVKYLFSAYLPILVPLPQSMYIVKNKQPTPEKGYVASSNLTVRVQELCFLIQTQIANIRSSLTVYCFHYTEAEQVTLCGGKEKAL